VHAVFVVRAQPSRPGKEAAPVAEGHRFWVVLTAIVAVGVAIRVLYTLEEAPWPPPGFDDQFFFSAQAHLLAAGRGFINPFQAVLRGVTVESAEHPPLYSIVLAGLAKLGLTSSDAQRLLGSALGAGTITTVGALARRLAGDRAGLLAAALAALYPVLIAADGALMSETLLGLLVALSLLTAHRLLTVPSSGRAIAFGGAVALATLTRGESALLLPFLLVPVARRPGGDRAALVAVVAFLVVLAPWTARNWIVFDRPVAVATNAGTAVGGANCDAVYHGDKLGGWFLQCLRDHPGKNEAENHDAQLRDGVHYAREHAGRVPVVLVARLGRVWSLYDPFSTPEGRSPRVVKLGVPAFFLLAALGMVGAVALRRCRGAVWILVAPFVIVSVTALATYGNLRFREPADVAVVVLAGVGLDAIWRRRQERAAGGTRGTA
jgi:4-amino-4-deoxy-L-arabinose transferase-like glycosyltransferase